ncbi:hypothetical protein COU78_01020 [Candidatus Peregrinibacteria bacterium CG10_big_fil_rev_8_21_14_0_10_49_24]|nr:MAG: hypothetical protein COV83_01270 [Candidatus Peregrinibacteria bacterium CG11_big_fil_rev_8_21_14_0_20_49_14]PIR51529.1 MAG: hypothetical protein COU78_01020 [Candidatus Peregrinibacteria bacterium CG10_big_fil_rev_8_21_14_0_10_49_24]PJA67828.1 MAG: hypothetical protein CO157_02320 [Candidatus Peregrinibacteria bacterium CG_4_9_14_3_um_filter_49_12]
MGPVIPDIGLAGIGIDPISAAIALVGSFLFGLITAWVYKATHRGLSYSQSFQFSLVLLSMLGAVVMMIASESLTRAIGILGAFSLIRFRTAIKDPKDMAYILLVLSTGLAMGAGMYVLAGMTVAFTCFVILILTWTNFGMTSKHEAVVRIMCKADTKGSSVNIASYEALFGKVTDSFRLLSAHARGDRMELTYGVRPKGGKNPVEILESLRKEASVEDAELFDAKHQVEF